MKKNNKNKWKDSYEKSKFRNYSFDSASGREIDPLYLFYNLKYCYDELRHFSDSQSSRGSLTKGLMSRFKIRLAPIPQQKKISKILYVLDEKILLNQKINHIYIMYSQILKDISIFNPI